MYFDPNGTISRICFSYDTNIELNLPWKDGGGPGGYRDSPRKHYSTSKKRIDITEKLNHAMIIHADELLNHAVMYGGIAATAYFIDRVRSGGDWDLKAQKNWGLHPSLTFVYNGKDLAFDDVGNIHYGFVGSILFSEEFLLFAGGLVQIVSGTSSFAYSKSNFDDPRDQEAISFGCSLWEDSMG